MTYYTPKDSVRLKLFGVEVFYDENYECSIFSTSKPENIIMQNLVYSKDYDVGRAHRVKDSHIQCIKEVDEVFVLHREYTDEIPKEDHSYPEFATPSFDHPIDHPYYQPWAEGVRKYIEENLTHID